MLDLTHPEIQFALNVTRRTSLLVRQVQAELVTPALTKDDRSPVTVADYAKFRAMSRSDLQIFKFGLQKSTKQADSVLLLNLA